MIKSNFFTYLKPKFKLYTLICLLSVVLLSESVGAKATFKQTQIAQQPTTQQDAHRDAALEAFMEGIELHQQGTAVSLRQAIEKWQQALFLWEKAGDKKWQAKTLSNIGLTYDSLGEKQQALKFYNAALPLSQQVEDKTGEAITLNNIGGVYDDLGDKQQALKFYNQALPLRKKLGNKAGEATTLNNIGLVYDSLGEKQQALKFYNQALPLSQKVGNKALEAKILNNIGFVYNSLGEKQQALKFYNSSLPLSQKVGDKAQEARTLSNIGVVYDSLGDKPQALKFYNSSLPLRKKVGDKAGEAKTLNNIGLVYNSLGDKQQALKFYNQALPLSKEVGDKAQQAKTLNNIGLVYNSLGEKQQALKFYNQALPLSKEVGDKAQEASTLYNIAYLERSRGNLQAARTNVEAAITIIEELRTKIDSKELRTSYFATQQDVYQFYIDLLMELHKKAPSQGYDALALHYSERSRARSLIELLNEAHAKILQGANPELVAQERDLRQQIDARDTLRLNLETSANKNDTITKAAIQKLTTEISNLLNQYRDVQAKIRATSPAYAQLNNLDPEKDILKLPQIQQQLDKDTLLLQYSLGEERSYLWAVTPTSMQVYTLPPRKQIEDVATKFHQSLQQGSASDLSIPNAQQLSKLILAPVADKLPGKRLVIVADGGLQTIPFAALADVSFWFYNIHDKITKQNHEKQTY